MVQRKHHRISAEKSISDAMNTELAVAIPTRDSADWEAALTRLGALDSFDLPVRMLRPCTCRARAFG